MLLITTQCLGRALSKEWVSPDISNTGAGKCWDRFSKSDLLT